MKIFLRNFLALIAGLFVGSVVNMGLVFLGPLVIAPPAGLDMTDATSLAASAHLLEPKHFLFPFLAHASGTCAGALVAYLLAGTNRMPLAFVVGVVFLAGGFAAATMIPAPEWFLALDLLVAYLPMAWLGTVFGRRMIRSPAD